MTPLLGYLLATWPFIKEAGQDAGYLITVYGSVLDFRRPEPRDLDLIAVPWRTNTDWRNLSNSLRANLGWQEYGGAAEHYFGAMGTVGLQFKTLDGAHTIDLQIREVLRAASDCRFQTQAEFLSEGGTR